MKGMFSEKQKVGLVAIAACVAVLAVASSAKAATWVVCGQWPRGEGDGLFSMIANLLTLNLRGFVGTTESGCEIGNGLLVGVPVAVLIVAIVALMIIVAKVDAHRHSDKALRRAILRRKEVVAGPAEVARELGAKNAIARGKKVRAEHAAVVRKKFKPGDAAFELGTSHGVTAYVSMEDAVLLIGPPRMGKGFGYVISDIVSAPGPVVTTSTRGDNMSATILARSKKGPVWVFDPEGVTGRESTLRWSPILGCEDGDVAKERADRLIEGTGLGAGDGGNNQEFATKAVQILQALLHAAAIGDVGLDELYLWTKSPEAAKDAVQVLRDFKSSLKWDRGLEATLNQPADQLAHEWFGVASSLGPVDVPGVRELFDARNEAESFDIDRFLDENGTLYLISPLQPAGRKSAGLGVMMAMLLDSIADAAHRKAMQAESERLDPPLKMELDEIAQIFPWPAMPSWMAAGSGEGIQVVAVIQSRAQLRAGWGADGAETVWEAATRKIILGGGAIRGDLEEISALVGERLDRYVTENWGGERETGFGEGRDKIAGISPDEIRRLPENTVLVIAGRARAIYVDLVPWIKRPFAGEIKESIGWHKKNRGSAVRGERGAVFPVLGLSAQETQRIEAASEEEVDELTTAGDGSER
ncbi:MAG: TraM recognition domain-containing protein [Brachybacterium sp.]|nr:TraM recognition domain-containing protein [Brachybacterium sp.]